VTTFLLLRIAPGRPWLCTRHPILLAFERGQALPPSLPPSLLTSSRSIQTPPLLMVASDRIPSSPSSLPPSLLFPPGAASKSKPPTGRPHTYTHPSPQNPPSLLTFRECEAICLRRSHGWGCGGTAQADSLTLSEGKEGGRVLWARCFSR